MGAQGQQVAPQAQGKGGASAKPFQQMQNMNQMGNAPKQGLNMGPGSIASQLGTGSKSDPSLGMAMQPMKQAMGQMGGAGQAGKGGGIKQPQQQMPGGMAGGMRIGLK